MNFMVARFPPALPKQLTDLTGDVLYVLLYFIIFCLIAALIVSHVAERPLKILVPLLPLSYEIQTHNV
jgi:hypothetical protein